MFLYNTLSEKKEKLEKTSGKNLKLFVCGPTVYDDAHIGHGRAYITFDAFVKFLKSEKWKIFYLQNITDIDDKIINRARAEKINPLKLAKKFENSYCADMKKLSVSSVIKYARASAFIPQIVKQTQVLIKKNYAYKIENQGWYFDINRVPDYGKLSKRTAVQAEDGVSRIDDSIMKKNKGDFALWKFVPVPENCSSKFTLSNGEPAWKTPLGYGRPGWHIEDTAISEHFFGSQYDIHGGGLDLKFPHHEAEIAQQESASGKKPFVKIWMHVGLVRIDNEKMSKSLGNFITIKKLLESVSPLVFRWWILSHHYRSPIIYTEKNISQALESLKTIKEFLTRLEFVAAKSRVKKESPDITQIISASVKKIRENLFDDFNTPAAFATIFSLIGEINKSFWSLSSKDARAITVHVKSNLNNLGLSLKTIPPPKKIIKMAGKRDLLRANQQFIHADALRKDIEGLGYKSEDTPLGTLIY